MAASYRVRHQIIVVASQDSDEKILGFKRTEQSITQVVRTDLAEAKAETRSIAASATDEALEFGGIATAKLLYIETDQAVTIKLNGGTESFSLSPSTGAKAKLFWEGSFTSVSVTNPSADDAACLTYFIAG